MSNEPKRLQFGWAIIDPETDEVHEHFLVNQAELRGMIESVANPEKRTLLMRAFQSQEGQKALAVSMTPEHLRKLYGFI